MTDKASPLVRLCSKKKNTGPACHCGRSRLFPSSTLSTPFSLPSIGPACHCGRSRLFPPPTFSTPPSLLYLTGPACHCGRSRLSPSIFSTSLPLSLSYRPGLSLWQVPPFHPPSSLSYPLLPFPPPSYRPGLSLWQVPPISGFYLS